MLVNVWLAVKSNGSVRASKKKPTVTSQEVAVQLEIDVPESLFKKPHLVAKITIPESDPAANCIDAVMADNIKSLIHEATGLNFSIRVIPPQD